MGVHGPYGDLPLGLWGRFVTKQRTIIERMKIEETTEYKLMRRLIGIEKEIGNLIPKELEAVAHEKGLKNPMAIKMTEELKKLLAEKIQTLKQMTALTEKQMKQDTLEYELEEKAA